MDAEQIDSFTAKVTEEVSSHTSKAEVHRLHMVYEPVLLKTSSSQPLRTEGILAIILGQDKTAMAKMHWSEQQNEHMSLCEVRKPDNHVCVLLLLMQKTICKSIHSQAKRKI
jgi:hypothetical protein